LLKKHYFFNNIIKNLRLFDNNSTINIHDCTNLGIDGIDINRSILSIYDNQNTMIAGIETKTAFVDIFGYLNANLQLLHYTTPFLSFYPRQPHCKNISKRQALRKG
jgi:hypothetical protein